MIFKELDDLQAALASASNGLYDVPDEYDSEETIMLRAAIDKHIDEALEALRSWREAMEEEGGER